MFQFHTCCLIPFYHFSFSIFSFHSSIALLLPFSSLPMTLSSSNIFLKADLKSLSPRFSVCGPSGSVSVQFSWKRGHTFLSLPRALSVFVEKDISGSNCINSRPQILSPSQSSCCVLWLLMTSAFMSSVFFVVCGLEDESLQPELSSSDRDTLGSDKGRGQGKGKGALRALQGRPMPRRPFLTWPVLLQACPRLLCEAGVEVSRRRAASCGLGSLLSRRPAPGLGPLLAFSKLRGTRVLLSG